MNIKINKTYIFLFLILILAFVIRIFLLSQNFFFGFEQGRDAQIAHDIVYLKKLTLIGPKTDIAGIFHGAWYYYLISVLYFIAHGSPLIVLAALALLNALTCIVVFFTTLEVTSNKKMALLSSLIYALSFNAIIYSRWLSNVSPSIFFSALFFYFLIKYIKEKKNGYWILLVLAFSFLFHFELLNGLYGIFLLTFLFILKKIKLTLPKVGVGAGIFTLVNLPFIIFDIRHKGILTQSILGYLLKSGHKGARGNIFVYIHGLYNEITRTLFPSSGFILLIFLFFVVGGFLYYFHKNKKRIDGTIMLVLSLCIIWSFPYIFLIKEYPLEHFYAGTLVPVIILICYLVYNNISLVKKMCLLIFPFWILINSFYIFQSLSTTTNIFYHSVQKTLHYKDQINVMDYIFSYSTDEFHYVAFTIPYYMEDSWQYLYNWYGNAKYKKMIAKNEENKGKKYVFLIIEPSTEGVFLDKWLKSFETNSVFVSEKMFGHIKVIVRKNIEK